MAPPAKITARLRDRLIGDLHLGRLHAGDRLAGVRQVAVEFGVGVRAVVRAYRKLETEGLVEIRSRSGVYVAPQERLGAEVLQETAGWLAGTLVESLKRRIPIPALAELVQRCTATMRPRVALLESTEDHLTILGTELTEEYGFDVQPLHLGSPATESSSSALAVEKLAKDSASLDVLVTTAFHAARARALAEHLGKPLVVVTVHPDVASVLELRLRAGRLTVVCADASFGGRVQMIYGARYPGRVQVVLAHDSDRVAQLDVEEPVLLTLAARQHLGETALRNVLPHSPSISPESGRELARLLIGLNLQAVSARSPQP